MRVLHTTSALDPIAGGVATALGRLAESQAAAGVDVRVLSTWVTIPTEPAAEQLRQRGVKVRLLQCRDPRSQNPEMAKILAEEFSQVDLIHVHGMWEEIQYWSGKVARQLRKPYVFTPHGMIAPWCLKKNNIPKRLYLHFRMRKNLDAAAAIHYTSSVERDLCEPLRLKAPALVEPNGLDLSEFTSLPGRGEFRRRCAELADPAASPRRGAGFNLDMDRPMILCLGRLNPKKGLDLLIPAFAKAAMGDAMLVLAGPDEDGYQHRLEALAEQHGVLSRVLFTGMLYGKERIEALADADLFALPSYQENFGIVVAEALAAGCPVIISDQVNIYSDVIEADAGAVVPCDVGAVADALTQWMADEARRRGAGERGRAMAFERYDSSCIAQRWLGHYSRMIGSAQLAMKVLHVISSIDLRGGGPATALAGLSVAQVHAGLDVRAISTFRENEKTDLADRLASEGVKTCVVGPTTGRLGNHPDLCPMLAEAIGESDIVHIHAIWEEIQHQAARICQAIRRPYIFRPCGMLDPWSLGQGKWKKKIYMMLRLRKDLNGAVALHFTTGTERDLVKPLGLTARSMVEPNGVHLDEFDVLPAPGTFRARYAQIGSAPLIVFLSRVHHKKGLDLLIPAFAKLSRKDAMLVIAGPDADGYGEQVRAMVAEHKVGERVIFTGMLYGADRVAALADADLFCLPSYQENFGIAVVEALAAGTPVVISDQVNIYSDVLAAGVGGVVRCEVDALASELTRWLEDAEMRSRAAAAARPFVWQRYDWKQIALRWSEHYREIVGQRGAAHRGH